MSRPKQFYSYVQVRVTKLEDALLRYYAQKYNKDLSAILRGMMRQYVQADQSFAPKSFAKFVEETIESNEGESEPLEQAELRQQLSEFLAAYPKRPFDRSKSH